MKKYFYTPKTFSKNRAMGCGLETKQSHYCLWFSSLLALVKKNYEVQKCNDYSAAPTAKYLEGGETFEANLSSCFTQSISAAAWRKAIYSLQKYSKAKDKQSICFINTFSSRTEFRDATMHNWKSGSTCQYTIPQLPLSFLRFHFARHVKKWYC